MFLVPVEWYWVELTCASLQVLFGVHVIRPWVLLLTVGVLYSVVAAVVGELPDFSESYVRFTTLVSGGVMVRLSGSSFWPS